MAGEDQAFADELLNRKAPLSLTLRYHLIDWLSRVDGVKKHCQAFLDRLPLAPQLPAAAA